MDRVREAILDCETAMLVSAKALGEDVLALATNRIDQLVAGIDQLESLDVSKWVDAELPELATSTMDAPRPLLSKLRQIAATIVAALRSAQPNFDEAKTFSSS